MCGVDHVEGYLNLKRAPVESVPVGSVSRALIVAAILVYNADNGGVGR